ncbi:hypothetical protein LCGC14_1451010 [marine sediment metagenome]|uniref:Uncharacterized protein n=1 Tax=marine sediment metagenome TaxID=412755 RepID=A0A0F9LYK0_9ZZZZ
MKRIKLGRKVRDKLTGFEGIDLHTMHVYLAGRISGENIDLCLGWRHKIIEYYKNYKGRGAYPISFLCPLNSGEAESVDKKGLTSSIPPNLIFDKDLLSVQHADVVVANLDDFFEVGIEDLLDPNIKFHEQDHYPTYAIERAFSRLQDKVLNRRENIGTIFEIAWAMLLNKPLILIVPERRQETFRKHPFTCRASVIVTSVDELVDGKYLNLLYKSIAGATY